MVYIMELYTDGGCRGNGYLGAIGAAAVVHRKKYGGRRDTWSQSLPSCPRPTSQRAEITAVIMALDQVLLKYETLNRNPRLQVTIHSDSMYTIKCMSKWVYRWMDNGWMTSKNTDVANQDLIEQAIELQNRVEELGTVRYVKVSREENEEADELCNLNMDEQES